MLPTRFLSGHEPGQRPVDKLLDDEIYQAAMRGELKSEMDAIFNTNAGRGLKDFDKQRDEEEKRRFGMANVSRLAR